MWVAYNVIEPFLHAKRNAALSAASYDAGSTSSLLPLEGEIASVTFVEDDGTDMILVADAKLHVFHLGPVMSHQELRQPNEAVSRALTPMEQELRVQRQASRDAAQNRITLMLGASTVPALSKELNAAEGASRPAPRSPRIFVQSRK